MLRVYAPSPEGFDETRHRQVIEALRAHFHSPTSRGLRVWNLRRVTCRLGACDLCREPVAAGWSYRQIESGVVTHRACAERLAD